MSREGGGCLLRTTDKGSYNFQIIEKIMFDLVAGEKDWFMDSHPLPP